MDISVDDKVLAQYLAKFFKGEPSIDEYWDENETNSVDIMTVEEVPEAGVTSAATLGLSNVSVGLEVDGQALRVEIAMAFASEEFDGPNIVATAALNVMKDGLDVEPGAIQLNVVETYLPQSDMKHLLLTHPFTWPLQSQKLTRKTVAWLQAVPISQAEYELSLKIGVDALEDLLEAKSVDVYDLNRPSAV